MATKSGSSGKGEKNIVNVALDLILKIGAIFLVVFLCFQIVRPFLSIIIWSLIIAIILYPLFLTLSDSLGKRKKLTALLMTLLMLAILVLPSIWLVNQLVDGVKFLAGNMQDGNLKIPPPSESVATWPIIGPWLYEKWLGATQNLGESVKGFMPQISSWGQKLLVSLANTGLGVLQFAISIILSGIFLIFFDRASATGNRLFHKLAGDRGEEFLNVSLLTIRNVATGVLGVAIIQSSLMGLGLVLADIPLAAVWIIIILIMSIAQIPVILFNIPLIIYLFAFMDPLPAILWSVYFLIMGLVDNVLKPLIMGKGASVPMLVIFFGAIGGFIAFGFMGLFLGAIILSLAYKLYVTWVNSEDIS